MTKSHSQTTMYNVKRKTKVLLFRKEEKINYCAAVGGHNNDHILLDSKSKHPRSWQQNVSLDPSVGLPQSFLGSPHRKVPLSISLKPYLRDAAGRGSVECCTV